MNRARQYRLTLEGSFLLATALTAVAFHAVRFPDMTNQPPRHNVSEPIAIIPITFQEQRVTAAPPLRPVVPIRKFAESIFEPDIAATLDTSFLRETIPSIAPPMDTAREEPNVFIPVPEVYPVLHGGEDFVRKHLLYPHMARLAKMEGMVVLKVFIDASGNVVEAVLVSETGNVGFGQAALDFMATCTFAPALQRGRPVPVVVNIPIRFRLK